jgi:hypothetical protein
MRNLVSILCSVGLTVVLLTACGEDKKEVFDGSLTITGSLQNIPEGQVVLSKYETEQIAVLDTLEVDDNGSFSYELNSEQPNFYDLDLF